MRKKMKSASGFTLTETLLTVLILSLVTAAVAGGVVTARDVYNRIRRAADAQTLASTAIHAITEDLESGTEFAVNGENRLEFISGSRKYRMYYVNSDQGIQVGNAENSSMVPLLTDKTETLDLHTEVVFPAPDDWRNGYMWFTINVVAAMDNKSVTLETEKVCVRLLAIN